MKKLMNQPDQYVDQMLEGIVAAHPELKRIAGTQVIVRAHPKAKVALVSGGGSGHEPAHAGYVGEGMLDAAVSGSVFTSPTPDQVLSAIRAVDQGQGVLLVIKNYTGDVMNFEMAADLASMEGIAIEKVIVADDVAVENSTYTVGQRGIAGTVFVHKIAGAAAEAGMDLATVKRIAEKVIANVHSMGMALSPCTVPASGKPSFVLGEDEVEIGIGIHGEPGTHRENLRPADEIVDTLLDRILAHSGVVAGDQVAVMLNGLGATPQSELYIAYRRVAERLGAHNIAVHKALVGEYMTSLEMAGFSISLLKLDDELMSLLDAPADTPAYRQR
ncbi:dihydroxyacetone kinase subunit DhaK [Alicyclobacillus hesperidum subsp. aegles]|uniref:dihydroxyacetone kinase subunit DhaK n=1 Tax=Alicyclobacillus hesperidum TaxID=89784 RepID=UPI00222C0881|nr:dihydroxyacetone kinase subunit DhaK [Alicyclobacillus hesperidum]GLG01969.1 dihydroxyacetone kinase subunit DhaK [Alicyclobacillus hesperidum subsp. aegles]